MSLIPRYLVTNRTTLVANMAGFLTEYSPVYQRNIPVYKGIENTLEFQILNPDQKPISLIDKIPHFVAFDAEKNLAFEQSGEITISNKGLFKITISESDTLNLQSQYLSYSIYLTDAANTNKTLTYADEQLNATGTIYISSTAFPGPAATKEFFFTQPEDIALEIEAWYTESMYAEPETNGNEGLHTAVVYTNGYVGNVIVQATLENQIDGNSTISWADVASISFSGTESQPTPINFNGVYSYIRFKATVNPANTITKILVRN
jgi:hypothetical protein